MGKLANKVALVTGASKGIGAAIAEHLAANFLASDDARWITGQVIIAAGGRRM